MRISEIKIIVPSYRFFSLGVQRNNIRNKNCLKQNEAQNKHDSAEHKGGTCFSTQVLGDWFGLNNVTFVAHGRLTAGHSALGHFKSGNFINVLSQAIRTTVFRFDFGTDAL